VLCGTGVVGVADDSYLLGAAQIGLRRFAVCVKLFFSLGLQVCLVELEEGCLVRTCLLGHLNHIRPLLSGPRSKRWLRKLWFNDAVTSGA
jgi:hypothetical protein